jgi:histidine triad (HIT) family protein
MSDCIFCKIIAGEIPSQRVYDDEYVIAFNDISPKAPVHILVVPREHIPSIAEIDQSNSHLAAKCLEVIAKLAKSESLTNGFRTIANSGSDGGQTVDHLHFHILGGRALGPGLINNK